MFYLKTKKLDGNGSHLYSSSSASTPEALPKYATGFALHSVIMSALLILPLFTVKHKNSDFYSFSSV